MWDSPAVWIAVGAFLLNLVTISIDAILKHAISEMRVALLAAIAAERKDTTEEFEKLRREVGEVGGALRQKIQEVELFSRDTFMRRDSFYKVQDTLQGDIKELGIEMRSRLERMETKIDSKT